MSASNNFLYVIYMWSWADTSQLLVLPAASIYLGTWQRSVGCGAHHLVAPARTTRFRVPLTAQESTDKR